MRKIVFIFVLFLIAITGYVSAQEHTESINVCSSADTTLNPGADNSQTYLYSWEKLENNSSSPVNPSNPWGPYQALPVPPITGYCEYRLMKKVGEYGSPIEYYRYNINIFDTLVVTLNASDDSICFGDSTVLTAHVSGGTGSYSYQWRVLNDFLPPSSENSTWTVSQFESSTIYQVIVNDVQCTSYMQSGYDTVYAFNPTPGVLSADSISVCHDSTAFLSFSGQQDISSFEWQCSTDPSFQNPISLGSDATQQLNSGTDQISYYRVAFTPILVCNDETVLYSDTAVVTFNPQIQPATVRTDVNNVCNGDSTTLRLSLPAQGGRGEFTYTWQKSVDGCDTSFSDMDTLQGVAHNTGSLYDTTWFRAICTNQCGSKPSESIKVNVYPLIDAGSLMSDTLLCNGESITISFDTTPSCPDSTATYYYQWFHSQSGEDSNYNNIPGNSSSLTPNNLTTGDHYYKVRVYAFGCKAQDDTTNPVHITVYAPISDGDIRIDNSLNKTLCWGDYESSPIVITDGFTGGERDSNTFQWYRRSTISSQWDMLEGCTQDTLNFDSALHVSYYYKLEVSNRCGTMHSNDSVYIHVYDQLHAPTVNRVDMEETTFCYGHQVSNVHITTPPTGSAGDYQYQWQYSVPSQEWQPASGFNNDMTYSPGQLTETTLYQVRVTSATCVNDTTFSDPVTIGVLQPLTIDIIEDTTVCYNEGPMLVAKPHGGVDSPSEYQYRWQKSSGDNTVSFSVFSTDSVCIDTLLTAARYYRLIVMSTKGCEGYTSNDAHVTVFNEFIDGNIKLDDGEGNIRYDTAICWSLPTPGAVVITNGFTGGDSVNNTYQWYRQATLADTLEPMPNQTNDSLIVASHKESNYFKLKVSNVCGDRWSDSVHISLFEPINPPVISKDDDTTMCYGMNRPGVIYRTVAPSGWSGDGEILSIWEYKHLTDTVFYPIEGTNNMMSYHPDTLLTSTTLYRLHAWPELCGSSYWGFSDTITINVLQPLTLSNLEDATVCYNTGTTLSVSVEGGADSTSQYRYQWFGSSGDDSTSILSITVQDSVYQVPSLTDGRFYRLIVSSTKGCESDTTNLAHVTVYEDFTNGSIIVDTDSYDTVCYNQPTNNPIVINNGFHGGDSLNNTYQWFYRDTNSSNWHTLLGHTQSSLSMDSLKVSRYYKLKVSNKCGVKTSTNDVYIHVYDTMQAPVISREDNEDTTFCYGHQVTNLITTIPSGSSPYKYYEWQDSTSSHGWSPINTDISDFTSYELGTLNTDSLKRDTIFYRVMAIPQYCKNKYQTDEYNKVSDIVSIIVLQDLMAGTIVADDDYICYDTTALLSFSDSPKGADGTNDYQYQWYQSSSSFYDGSPINQANDSTYSTDQASYYYVKVTSKKCQDSDSTNRIQVNVHPEFKAPTFDDSLRRDDLVLGRKVILWDSVCDGSAPHENRKTITVDTSDVGGEHPYDYHWEVSNDNCRTFGNPHVIWNRDSIELESKVTETLYYRLTVTSKDGCGDRTTDTIKIEKLDLPDLPNINGEDTVWCNNHDIVYFIGEGNTSMRYDWEVTPGGNIISAHDSIMSVRIDWTEYGDHTINLTVTNRETRCENKTEYNVYVDASSNAPNTTRIKRKGKTNILICLDSTSNAVYQWGFIEKSSLKDSIFPNSNFRYFQYPQPIDTSKFDYFVQIHYGESKCDTRTYYVLDELDEDWWSRQGGIPLVKIMPNPSKGDIYISVDDDIIGQYILKVVDMYGREIFSETRNDLLAYDRVKLNKHLSQGIYYVVITTDTWQQSIRVAVQ